MAQRNINVERAKVLRQAYQMTFGGSDRAAHQVAVLEHLKSLCHYEKSIIDASMTRGGNLDPLKLAVMEGRRQVFIAIQEQLMFTEAQISQLAARTAQLEEKSA